MGPPPLLHPRRIGRPQLSLPAAYFQRSRPGQDHPDLMEMKSMMFLLGTCCWRYSLLCRFTDGILDVVGDVDVDYVDYVDDDDDDYDDDDDDDDDE